MVIKRLNHCVLLSGTSMSSTRTHFFYYTDGSGRMVSRPNPIRSDDVRIKPASVRTGRMGVYFRGIPTGTHCVVFQKRIGPLYSFVSCVKTEKVAKNQNEKNLTLTITVNDHWRVKVYGGGDEDILDGTTGLVPGLVPGVQDWK